MRLVVFFGLLVIGAAPVSAQEITAEAIAAAQYGELPAIGEERHPRVAKLQILLDRTAISPGIIDGRMGENVENALRSFATMKGLESDGGLDKKVWAELESEGAGDILATYTITAEDTDGPFVEAIPEDYADMAKMKQLAYSGPLELLSETFHMDPELLKMLNPSVDFGKTGQMITVAAVADPAPEVRLTHIVVRKADKSVRGFVKGEKLAVAYPATIGSEDTPSPSGTWEVKGVARNPVYEYRPNINFQQGENEEPLTIPAGPNGPVGTVWIDLTKPTYGIHGTAEPAEVGKVASHGCVRLTNWDAEELAKLVKPGTKVEFVD